MMQALLFWRPLHMKVQEREGERERFPTPAIDSVQKLVPKCPPAW